MAGCVVCGAAPDGLALRLDVTFMPGPVGPRTSITVPHRAAGVEICAACWRENSLLRALLERGDDLLEPVAALRGRGCRVECTGHRRGRAAAWWSPFRGHRGVPEVGRCPVCWGPIAVEEET